MLLMVAGCTSSWRAPMETRGGAHAPATASTGRSSRIASNARQYRVRRGDTLYAIAWRANRDFHELARWNGIRPPYVIYEGQMLRLRPVTSARSHSSGAVARRKQQTARHPNPRPDSASRSKTPERKEKPVTSSGRLHWAWPASGKLVSTYKAGDPLRKGVKISAKEGSPVRAAGAGKVVYSGSGLIGYGQLIIIKHNDKYLSAYGHNRKLLVKQGQQVTRGQKIAEMGRANDGRALLHFEIRRYGKPIDPLAMLPRR